DPHFSPPLHPPTATRVPSTPLFRSPKSCATASCSPTTPWRTASPPTRSSTASSPPSPPPPSHRDRTRPRAPRPARSGPEPGSAVASVNAVDLRTLDRLQLLVTRRLDGLLHGDYLGLLPGPGSEPGEAREYRAGDDVRHIDWPVTARTTVPHVRTTVADRELEAWLAVDLSPSLDFGTVNMLKRDLAINAVAAFSYLAGRGGNRVGAVVT